MKRRGFVIILVLAVLLLLALLAITYVILSMTDRTIARNYVDNKRARLIAQSGVDYAIARIQEDIFDTSWQEAKTVTINGTPTKYTESSGSTYGENRDIFAVTVKDCQLMINVNDGLSANTGGNERVTGNLKRILNNLGEIVSVANLGNRIIDKRPQTGYSSKQELLRAVNITEFNSIKDFVTTHTWQDENVANPVPLSSAVANYYPEYYRTPASFRYGRGAGSLLFAPEATAGNTENHMLYALDELNPQWIEIVSRSPVNVNNAAPEVLAALIKDLKGFFVLERRKSRPLYRGPYDIYATNDLAAGYIYTTQGIDISKAQEIANEIKDCRGQTGNYTTKWYGGNFRTWRQFNAFIEDHVEVDPANPKIIKDPRTDVFYDYKIPLLNIPFWELEGSTSTIAIQYANQAIADVLKANFNPNLHLNELNPDANIASANGGLVDKTDLIVNSAEFCFTPMGYFEIKSEGYILRPNGPDNTVIAKSKIYAVVKLYDCYRETTQKQFLGGQIATNANNEKTLEIGPEPSATLAQENLAKENEWGGYIALPTLKGSDSFTTAIPTLIAHYTTSFNADSHAGSAPNNLNDQNNPDPTEILKSPYNYGQISASGQAHTLAKSYRQGDGKNTTERYAVADLRIDGTYVERESGLAYDTGYKEILKFGNPVFVDCKVIKSEGVVSYWIKPFFKPQLAGRPRTFFSMTRVKSPLAPQGSSGNVPFTSSSYGIRSFANWFCASHLSTADASYESASFDYSGKPCYFPLSMIFGYSYEGVDGDDLYTGNTGRGIGACARSLNHLHHPGTYCGSNITYLAQGHWIHVIVTWDLRSTAGEPAAYPMIFVNGQDKTYSIVIHDTDQYGTRIIPTWFEFVYTMRRLKIGEPTISGETTGGESTTFSSGSSIDQNYTSDSTVDEFYVFQENSTVATQTNSCSCAFQSPDPLCPSCPCQRSTKKTGSCSCPTYQTTSTTFDALPAARNMYTQGRYYIPLTTESNYTSTSFTSVLFKETSKIAKKSLLANPAGSFGAEGDLASDQKVRIIGVSYTWYAGSLKPDGTFEHVAQDPLDSKYKPILKNYQDYATAGNIFPSITVQLIKNAEPPYNLSGDDGFSYPANQLEVQSTDEIKYKLIFSSGSLNPNNTTLLYSPIFDDITIYYTSGVKFLSYSYLD